MGSHPLNFARRRKGCKVPSVLPIRSAFRRTLPIEKRRRGAFYPLRLRRHGLFLRPPVSTELLSFFVFLLIHSHLLLMLFHGHLADSKRDFRSFPSVTGNRDPTFLSIENVNPIMEIF